MNKEKKEVKKRGFVMSLLSKIGIEPVVILIEITIAKYFLFSDSRMNKEKKEKEAEEEKKEKRGAVANLLSKIGIEPVVILINLGRCMIGVQIANLYIEKTCKVGNVKIERKSIFL